MDSLTECRTLEQYASLAQCKLLSSQSDLDPSDRAHPMMLSWCRRQKTVVALTNGNILTSDPQSRVVQNCKIVMHNKQLIPGQIFPATQSLIAILLANAEETDPTSVPTINEVSTQQHRLRMLVKEALDGGATDIHLEVRHDTARIRFRKHGELYLHAEWLPNLAREIASVAFNRETDHTITHFNPRVPQNASMQLAIDNHQVRLRLASLPAHAGYDVVMRILTVGDDQVKSLEDLGYLPSQIHLIEQAVQMPHGAVIVSGPTGSGKTTSLASCLQMISSQRKVYSIEDPVEKVVAHTTQVPVQLDFADRSFASMARTALRMDPDVIVLGEMRDEESTRVMMRAALTGHLVFSTVHTNSAPEIVTRLADMGIKHSQLASPDLLVCLICQRLAPVLCRHCAIPVGQSPKHQSFCATWFDAFPEHYLQLKARGKDCQHCHGLGISGRTVVAEVVWVDEEGRQFIQLGDTLGWTKYLRRQGWKNYRDHLMVLVQAGVVDPLDAQKMVGPLV